MIRALIGMLVTYVAILLILQLVPSQLFLSGLFVSMAGLSWFLVAAVGGSICAWVSQDHPVSRSVVVASIGMPLMLAHSNWGALAESARHMALIGVMGIAVAASVAFGVWSAKAQTKPCSEQAAEGGGYM